MNRFLPALLVLLAGCSESPNKQDAKNNANPVNPTPVAQAVEPIKAPMSSVPAASKPAEAIKQPTTIAKIDEACCDDDGLKKAADAPPAAKIELTPIKLKQLLTKVADQKGKIVIIDLWGMFCKPCMEEFPNLVRLHHTYGAKGLVCMSLSLDDADDKARALKFLTDKKAVIPNFWLDEDQEVAQKHWDFEPVPVCVIYGRDGKLAKVFRYNTNENFTYKDVEKLIKSMLEAKAEPKKTSGVKIELTPVTMKDLLDKHVPAHKGKVVVLDVWGTFCPPCVAEFPKLVELHKNYRDKGVVCLAMSLNEEEDLPLARAFLEKHEAHFTNYWLPEGFDGVREVWKFDAIPVVVVFGRDGKIANIFRDSKFTYDDVEKVVKKLVAG